ncbi:hypothetical protein [Thermogutta sp.]|uniref:hypothetical protein n=1 Tax=Thermogutta sp. TaxID=1962930 RepID=UPI00321FD47C
MIYVWGSAVDQILAEENVDNGADETVQWTLTDHLSTVRDIAKFDPQTVFSVVARLDNPDWAEARGRLPWSTTSSTTPSAG